MPAPSMGCSADTGEDMRTQFWTRVITGSNGGGRCRELAGATPAPSRNRITDINIIDLLTKSQVSE
jgi:hypothetical protein